MYKKCPDFSICTLKYNINPPKNYLSVCEYYIKNHSGVFSPLWFKFNQKIECNKYCKYFDNCKNRNNDDSSNTLLKNIFGYCTKMANILHGSVDYCENLYCKICNKETPHKYNKNGELYCQVCVDEKVWCDHCQQYESTELNSHTEHWLFYKSRTKKWIQNYLEQFEYIRLIIDYKNNIAESKSIRGIYLWRIDDIPYYCDDSEDIYCRSYDHIYEMWNSPEYWLNIRDESVIRYHTISLEVLEVCDNFISDREMHKRQIEWINTVKPMSQKCDGTDHIVPLNQRKYNIDNLKEKYLNII